MGGSLLISNSCYKVAAKTHCTKMKVLARIALFASAASAFVVPLPAGVQAQVIKQCEGFHGAMNLVSGDMPDTINLPSKIPLNFVTELTEDLPGDLVIFMKLRSCNRTLWMCHASTASALASTTVARCSPATHPSATSCTRLTRMWSALVP